MAVLRFRQGTERKRVVASTNPRKSAWPRTKWSTSMSCSEKRSGRCSCRRGVANIVGRAPIKAFEIFRRLENVIAIMWSARRQLACIIQQRQKAKRSWWSIYTLWVPPCSPVIPLALRGETRSSASSRQNDLSAVGDEWRVGEWCTNRLIKSLVVFPFHLTWHVVVPLLGGRNKRLHHAVVDASRSEFH